MRHNLAKWTITLTICFAVPILLVLIFMPYLDVSHATYLTAQGDYNLALRTLNRAIRFNSGLASAYTRRGYVFDKLGEYGKALADYDHAISLSDTDWEPFNNRAWLSVHMKGADLTHALSDANEAISLCNSCAPSFDTRGCIELELGQLNKALEDLNHCLVLNPKLAEVYYHRALYYQKTNQPDKAKEDLERAQARGFYLDNQSPISTAGGSAQTTALAYPAAALNH